MEGRKGGRKEGRGEVIFSTDGSELSVPILLLVWQFDLLGCLQI